MVFAIPLCGLLVASALHMGAAGDEFERCTEDESALLQGRFSFKKSGNIQQEMTERSILANVEDTLNRGEHTDCNLCAHDWVIVLATGRSGSTSVLQMLNALPGFFIAGEHRGAIKNLMGFWREVFQTPGMPTNWAGKTDVVGFKNNTRSIGAWFHAARSKKHVLCTLQKAAQTLLGDIDGSIYTTLGFKEIRYDNKEALTFLTQLFPCARFVVNIRRNLKAQSHSAFWNQPGKRDEVLKVLKSESQTLRGWQAKDRSRRFLLELEDFSTHTFNSLLHWLGVTGCKYKQVAHANDDNSYNKLSAEALLAGTCSAQEVLRKACGVGNVVGNSQ